MFNIQEGNEFSRVLLDQRKIFFKRHSQHLGLADLVNILIV